MRIALVLVVAIGCRSPAPARPVPPLPHEAYAHYLAGKMAAHREDFEAAVVALERAAAAAPDQPMLAVELARAQLKTKNPGAAMRTLALARRTWPRHAQVWLVSGDVFAAMAPKIKGARGDATGAYERAIELAPRDERGYLGLAKLQDDARALATLRRLVERVPDSVDGRYRLAQRLAKQRDFARAIAQLRGVLERDPDHIDARLDLARALRISGELIEAVAQTRSAFDRSGQALDIAEELFWLLCEAEDLTAALDLLTLLDDERSDADALATVARLHRGLGRLDDARAIAAKIAKLDADACALVLAEIELAAGDPNAAAQRALAVGDKSAHWIAARRIAAAAFVAAGDPNAALAALAPARAARPRALNLASASAFALVDAGKPAEARAVLATLADTPPVVFARARLADYAGDTQTAIALAEAVVRGQPDHVGALNLAGYLLADRNVRLADAERYLRRARELAPGDPAILDSWGWLRLRQGAARDAVRALLRAARLAPREPEILVHLAAAWAADGAPRTAREVLERAATLSPRPRIQRQIQALRDALHSTAPPHR